jgi:1,4-alpha-glucan branching enzyme
MKKSKSIAVHSQSQPGKGKEVRFELSAAPGSKVFVAGSFNKWNPTANPMKDNPDSGHFKANFLVPEGKHEYKFVVNGAWITDPKCADSVPDGFGSLNSVFHV